MDGSSLAFGGWVIREQRKLAAIVAADVVGYSRLMGRDESGTLAALKSIRRELVDPLVASHGGRVVKSTGDGLLLDFASAVDAVRCAIAMQQGMAVRGVDNRIVFRIGINVGDIIVDGDDIIGDGVNVAARLEQIAEPGGICLADRAHHDIRGRIDVVFTDGGTPTLKNIEEAVRVWHWSGNVTPRPAPAREATASPSIAVLPFDVLSDQMALAHVADALVEDVIALLARMPGFFVISRASSFTFRDRATDVNRIARELGVRYIVEGSLRAIGNGVRVAVELTDAGSGRVLWSGRFEAAQDNTTNLQDEITRAIVGHLVPELTRAEIAVIRRRHVDNIDAWGHFFQASGEIQLGGWSKASIDRACAHLARATAVDPDFALAHAQGALLKALGRTLGIIQSPEIVEEVIRAAEKAIDLDPNNSEVLSHAGCALADIGQRERGLEILERAQEIDPSNAQAHVAFHATRGLDSATREESIAGLRYGMRLSPRDKRLGFWGWVLAVVLLQTGRLSEAVEEAKLASRRDPKLYLPRIAEAVGLVGLDRTDDARTALAAARKLRPELTLEEVRRTHGKRAFALLAPLWG